MDVDLLRTRIEARLNETGKKKIPTAERAGLGRDFISDLLAGRKDSVAAKALPDLAKALECSIDYLVNPDATEPGSPPPSAPSPPSIGVWGTIGAGAEVYPFSDYANDPMYEIDLPPTVDPEDQYVGFEIEGFSMPPAKPGWVVLFRKAEFSPTDFINYPCMVDTKDGRRFFKMLRKGYSLDRYNLESWDGSPLIEDIEVERALPFAALTPGRNAR